MVKMTTVNIIDKECWGCGAKGKITSHHAIPQHLKPIKNIVVPVCTRCHQRINNSDISSMFAYAVKIEKVAEDTRNSASKLKNMVEEVISQKKNEG